MMTYFNNGNLCKSVEVLELGRDMLKTRMNIHMHNCIYGDHVDVSYTILVANEA